MADPGVGTLVRYYLHYSNLSQSFYKQYGAAKKVKDDYEKQIIGTLQQSGMEKATIQIGGGQLNVIDKREPKYKETLETTHVCFISSQENP